MNDGIPDEVYHDSRFQHIYGVHAKEAIQNQTQENPDEISRKALAEYYRDQKKFGEMLQETNPDMQGMPEMSTLLAQFQMLTSSNEKLSQGQIKSLAEIEELKRKIDDLMIMMQILALYTELPRKKKKKDEEEEEEDATIFSLGVALVGLLLIKVLVDDEKAQKEAEENVKDELKGQGQEKSNEKILFLRSTPVSNAKEEDSQESASESMAVPV